ncbi:uncharacterized protein LOC113315898 [Papaver somniferum]|uniref:uncharacterized protein LOC113315898 n=1 Tax=Papaver somniferum TaxID=3469 RepID=UPI000E6FD6AF|nr:uncharacterized protein LOC113315898 [Papaver somniferum]
MGHDHLQAFVSGFKVPNENSPPGTHRGSKCIYLRSLSSAEHAESIALWEATKWAKERNMQQAVFEMDSKIVVDAVNNKSFNIDWRLRNLILDIKVFFSRFKSWHYVHVHKECNKVADSLSKLARIECVSGVWLLKPPQEISAKVQEEANIVSTHS